MTNSTISIVLHNVLAVFQAREQELGRLDAAAGDGDHGATMVRGLTAAVAAVEGQAAHGTGGDAADSESRSAPVGELLVWAGDAFADAAGGASGALFGALFCTVGRRLAGSDQSPAAVSAALDAGAAAVAKLGKAAPGDKTLLDALAPFAAEFAAGVQQGQVAAEAWRAAVPAAAQGAAATADMIARRGRASRLGERSRGHVDPGAQSVVYLVQAVDAVLNTTRRSADNISGAQT